MLLVQLGINSTNNVGKFFQRQAAGTSYTTTLKVSIQLLYRGQFSMSKTHEKNTKESITANESLHVIIEKKYMFNQCLYM